MVGDGVSDSAGAGEGVGGMVNGAGLTSRSIARSWASEGGSTVGAETLSRNAGLLSVIHKLPDSTLDHICRQFETAYQLVLQSQYTPGLNIH